MMYPALVVHNHIINGNYFNLGEIYLGAIVPDTPR
jgi:hypothetical protein